MLDIDGTVIPYDFTALPSEKLRITLEKAQEKVAVFLVTGRSYYSTKPIIEALGLTSSYVVVDNGAYVLDLENQKSISENFIEPHDVNQVATVLTRESVPFYVKDIKTFCTNRDFAIYEPNNPLEDVSMVFTDERFPGEKIDRIMEEFSSPTLNVFKVKHKDPRKFGISFTHAKATKLHGIAEVIKLLNISKQEIVGVGDGYNDLSLLMASGLKVAMGNAIDELKEVADFIAPSVDDDGVATVVEKFIL